ncbi:hypothetical protein VSR01_16665 [Actinacidiphila sp. DG2A-62]|uniref:hypothetical protein n=1 Tax=Actinacidiphila sp. DG2A-62 TaxID=3108821 RepID=UPI002DBC4D2F|nr:hypothetical protein [Actinacidiphila sp. DG2A-62]MEC3995080.1 hypothetical protein [Actinacidiphila sp. DG2A-62]
MLGDGGVERGAQGAADRLAGRVAIGLAVGRHRGQLLPLGLQALGLAGRRAAGQGPPAPCFLLAARAVLGADHVRVVGDGVEHRDEVADAEAVQAVVTDARLEVVLDVGAVAVVGRGAGLLAAEPAVEPLGHGHLAVERHAQAELLGDVGRRGDRLAAVAGDGGEEVADALQVGLVFLRQVEDGLDVGQVAVRLGDGGVAGTAEGAAVALGIRG